jgi:hypothetical protein
MIFGFLAKNLKTHRRWPVAFSMAWLEAGVEPGTEGDRAQARDRLAAFRGELYGCFTARADAMFDLADAVLCAEGPVKTWSVCRWRRSTGAGTGRCMTR